eukprot:TRINITY_DN763_c0_g1_i4.p1 TRINITY_DN763_c0_g1~~TRINITY_DN763_c0_g1_i4.p1  ORF type:complete len:759 (-),score=-2.43 TRINITY_DN763_c0_g1_i4:134-2410(-)
MQNKFYYLIPKYMYVVIIQLYFIFVIQAMEAKKKPSSNNEATPMTPKSKPVEMHSYMAWCSGAFKDGLIFTESESDSSSKGSGRSSKGNSPQGKKERTPPKSSDSEEQKSSGSDLDYSFAQSKNVRKVITAYLNLQLSERKLAVPYKTLSNHMPSVDFYKLHLADAHVKGYHDSPETPKSAKEPDIKTLLDKEDSEKATARSDIDPITQFDDKEPIVNLKGESMIADPANVATKKLHYHEKEEEKNRIPGPESSVEKIVESAKERLCAVCYARHLSWVRFEKNIDFDYDDWHNNTAATALRYLQNECKAYETSKLNLATALITLCLEDSTGNEYKYVRIPTNQPGSLSKVKGIRIENISSYVEKSDLSHYDLIMNRMEAARDIFGKYGAKLGELSGGDLSSTIFLSTPHFLTRELCAQVKEKDAVCEFFIKLANIMYLLIIYLQELKIKKTNGASRCERTLEENIEEFPLKNLIKSEMSEIMQLIDKGTVYDKREELKSQTAAYENYATYIETASPPSINSAINGLFTHSEQFLMNHISSPPFFDQLKSKTKEQIKTSGWKLKWIYLDLHTIYYPCPICEYSIIGLMNDTSKNSFIYNLQSALKELEIESDALPKIVCRISSTSLSKTRRGFACPRKQHRRIGLLPTNWNNSVIFLKDINECDEEFKDSVPTMEFSQVFFLEWQQGKCCSIQSQMTIIKLFFFQQKPSALFFVFTIQRSWNYILRKSGLGRLIRNRNRTSYIVSQSSVTFSNAILSLV